MTRRDRHTDLFAITSGGLGPVPRCELEIRPLTVFVGRQGTGKSLIAQVLYAFEELPFLLARAGAERGASKRPVADLFRWILDRLRSADRAFATFANRSVHVSWRRGQDEEWPTRAPRTVEFHAYQVNRRITLNKTTARFLEQLRASDQALHHAVFFPTERVMTSMLRSSGAHSLLSLPLTFELFSHWLDVHVEAAHSYPQTLDQLAVRELSEVALGGVARRRGDQWKWRVSRSQIQFDLDMASSGQRANWSLGHVCQALLGLVSKGDVGSQLTLFVEEPEIHLHPTAQREMVKLLAFMVNRGFRVVLTTHSMTVLYALNNLIQAGLLGEDESKGVPEAEFRIKAADVSVYAFESGVPPRPLVDRHESFIDERPLGQLADELAAELNRIGTQRAEREQ
ncbi:MAG: ATP-binding protein [Archangium sp.]|nr:ATP-binding protein [Archangium sp.]